MTKSQKSEYLKLKDMLKPGYKPDPDPNVPRLNKIQIRQKMKVIYLDIIQSQ